MTVRILCAIASLLLAGSTSWAQTTQKVPMVAVLMMTAGPEDATVQSFRAGLRSLGYVEGQNITVQHRWARGHQERLPLLAKELVALNPDVIVTGAEPLVRAARDATNTIPIVMVLYDYDPVASGLVDSFSRPGRNITGVFTLQTELVAKRLELLKEALPRLSRVAAFWDSFSKRQLSDLKGAASSLGIALELIELQAPYDFRAAFSIAKRKRADGVVVLFSPVFYSERDRIAALALEFSVPTMSQEELSVTAGGFISYGPSVSDTFGRAAYFVDRILKGLEVDHEPELRGLLDWYLTGLHATAKALGITIPESILLRADEVIR